ncbi:hypothetical protein FACS189437_02590 [Bacteroidia bacterium]|nr:hypothetical protein FACS189437_02590 [Bacteroidia bacterium]
MKIDYVADFSLCSNAGSVRQNNEDNCGYAIQIPNGDLFVVCDGMGGHVGGARASKIAVESIKEHIKKAKYPNPHQALNDALTFANAQILGMVQENPELKGMGTTACVLLIRGDAAWIAHAGDSRIYLYVNQEKFLHRITTDHSYVQKILVEQEGMSEEEAEAHPKKNIILNALGIKADFKSEVVKKPIFPAKGDIFLICSDGLTGMVNDPIIESVLKKEITLQAKVAELINLAIQGGGKDNITAQLIQIAQSPWDNSEYEDKNPEWRKKRASKSGAKKKNNKNLISFLVLVVAIVVLVLVLLVGGYYMKISNLETQIEKAKTDLTICEEIYTKKDSIYTAQEEAFEQKMESYNSELNEDAKSAAETAMDKAKIAKNKSREVRDKACTEKQKKEKELNTLEEALKKWRNYFKKIKNKFHESNNNRTACK